MASFHYQWKAVSFKEKKKRSRIPIGFWTYGLTRVDPYLKLSIRVSSPVYLNFLYINNKLIDDQSEKKLK